MKQLAVVLMILTLGCANKSSNIETNDELVKQLFELTKSQSYFLLKSQLDENKDKLSKKYSYFFDAVINNAFNNPKASNDAIDKIINSDSKALPDSLMKNLYLKKINNHSRLFEYAKASKANKHLRENYSEEMDSVLFADIENTFNLYDALKEVPKQEVKVNSDNKISLTRDIANLLNIDVFFGDTKQHMIFDTGANMSVIRKSLVDKLGLKLIESNFLVGSSTGVKVKSKLAVADELKIGDIIVKNEVFLVFDDSALSFPGYDIYGIIGFPVIEGFKEIQITSDNELIVPKRASNYNMNNMAIDGLIPIISTKHKGDDLIFKLDTGAESTTLYSKYFKKYKTQIEQNYAKEKFGAGSAGGGVVFEGYLINDIGLQIGSGNTVINKLQLHTEKIGDKESNFYGNLGQDYIKQFDKMTLSFEYSSILFE